MLTIIILIIRVTGFRNNSSNLNHVVVRFANELITISLAVAAQTSHACNNVKTEIEMPVLA